MRWLVVVALVAGLALVPSGPAMHAAPGGLGPRLALAPPSGAIRARVGGLIAHINPAQHAIILSDTIASRTYTYTIEIAADTSITLSRWAASYADMRPGDHVVVSGYKDLGPTAPGPNPILATRIRINSPHFGGRILTLTPSTGGRVLTVQSRHGHVVTIVVPRAAAISASGRAVTIHDLRAGETIAAQGTRAGKFVLVATAVRIYGLPGARHTRKAATTLHLGGLVVRSDPAAHRLVISDKVTHRLSTIQTTPATMITLSRWSSSYADMHPGDHVSITGLAVPTRASRASPAIVATHIRIDLSYFGGTITDIAPGTAGGRVLTVLARHDHLLRVDTSGDAIVLYNGLRAHVGDLRVNEKVSVRGKRVGKFELVAALIHLYPHHHTIGGQVTARIGGGYRITAADGTEFIVHATATTRYTLNGLPLSTTLITPGLHIKVQGYDALRDDQPDLSTMVATHISMTLRLRRRPFHIAGLNFGGTILSIAPAPSGGVVLTVKGSRYHHALRIDAPPHAAVLYGAQAAQVGDLQVGEHIQARGTRVGEFELAARSLHIYLYGSVTAGTVLSVSTHSYRLLSATSRLPVIVYTSAATIYTRGGKRATAAAVAVGAHVAVQGYNALHPDQKGLVTVIATHISVTVPRPHPAAHHAKAGPPSKKKP